MDEQDELMALQAAWRRATRAEQEQLYAGALGVASVRAFSERPLAGADATPLERPRGLVSTLGFSWQPVALLAAWARPERVLVLATAESLSASVAGESVASLIIRLSGVPEGQFRFVALPDDDEAAVYRAVRDFAVNHGYGPRALFVDPTGGKKSFSAAVALAGFMMGAPLVYVDYMEYDPVGRVPVAGTEYPRLLRNPLEVFGETELALARTRFDGGRYSEARHQAEALAGRLYDAREAGLLSRVAAAYEAWSDKRLEAALTELEAVRAQLQQLQAEVHWPWTEDLGARVSAHQRLLRRMIAAREQHGPMAESILLVLNQVAAARRAAERDEWSIGLPLLQSAFEWYLVMRLTVDHGLDPAGNPAALVAGCADRFEAMGQRMHGDEYVPVEPGQGRLMYARALQFFATLNPGEIDEGRELTVLMNLARLRNQSDIAHIRALRPHIDRGDFTDCLNVVVAVLSRCPGAGDVAALLEQFRFPRLSGRPGTERGA